jgi:hypothetical protein
MPTKIGIVLRCREWLRPKLIFAGLIDARGKVRYTRA